MRDQAKALENLCPSRLRTVKKIAEDGMREPMLAYQPQEVFALDTRCRYQMGNSQFRENPKGGILPGGEPRKQIVSATEKVLSAPIQYFGSSKLPHQLGIQRGDCACDAETGPVRYTRVVRRVVRPHRPRHRTQSQHTEPRPHIRLRLRLKFRLQSACTEYTDVRICISNGCRPPKIIRCQNVVVVNEHEEVASSFCDSAQPSRREAQLSLCYVASVGVPGEIEAPCQRLIRCIINQEQFPLAHRQ